MGQVERSAEGASGVGSAVFGTRCSVLIVEIVIGVELFIAFVKPAAAVIVLTATFGNQVDDRACVVG